MGKTYYIGSIGMIEDIKRELLVRMRKTCNQCHRERRCYDCCVLCDNPCSNQIICYNMNDELLGCVPFQFTDEQLREAFNNDRVRPDVRRVIAMIKDIGYDGVEDKS